MPKFTTLQKWVIAIMLAFAAYFFLPAILGKGSKPPTVASLMNARKLCTACRRYAVDHQGNFPPSLDTLFPGYLTDRSILASPLKPDDPDGYTYTPGMKFFGPVNAVVIEDKFAPLQRLRIVSYVDGTARILQTP